jgi:hypothetical protein
VFLTPANEQKYFFLVTGFMIWGDDRKVLCEGNVQAEIRRAVVPPEGDATRQTGA